jgi:hypothetical protein
LPAINGVTSYTVTLGANTPTLGSLTFGSGAGATLVIGAFALNVTGGTGDTDLVSVSSGDAITMTTGGSLIAGGLNLNGSLTGAGTITIQNVGTASHTINGSGTITAASGTLDLVGAVTSGLPPERPTVRAPLAPSQNISYFRSPRDRDDGLRLN